ncbi:MAG: DUF2344 domain-containing protein, partial [Clostridiales Family XIII bacterium]|nr:DUF2344 domain-containing protein [Clostridiales Family XIII bacterium]
FEVEGGGPLPAVLKGRFNAYLPEGFRILEIWHLPEDAKSVAAQVAAAKYRIEIPFFFSYMEATMDFFGQEHIITEKTSKKTKRSEKVNIRPQIISLKPLLVNDNIIMLTSMLHCGSLSNLNPELMLRCFYQCSGKAYDRGAIRIERVALLGWGEDELLPLEYLQGAGGSANP